MRGGHPDEVPLTPEERRWIARFKACAKAMPGSLFLFCNGNANIIRRSKDGSQPETRSGGVDPDYMVDSVHAHFEGGDW